MKTDGTAYPEGSHKIPGPNEPAKIEEPAELVQMSVSSFHEHFKSVTSMSPLRYQKVLRLQEAWRRVLSTVMDAGFASQRVGYLSASQFSQEYSGFIGSAPTGMANRAKTGDLGCHPARGDGMTALAGWENFCVIVGSSAGALIGLQFVVITLIADMPIRGGQEQAGEAFAKPTIVHFGAALLLSAILNAPWQRVGSAAVLWGLLGLGGLVYETIVARRMQRQIVYTPEFENWLFHVLLPFAAYATLAGSAYAALAHGHEAMFGVAAAALLLLFIGIHNAWDAITYHVFVNRGGEVNERPR